MKLTMHINKFLRKGLTFVGGALSSYSGYSLTAAGSKTLTGEQFKGGYLDKYAHKIFAKYGTQNVLADFAFDEDQKFFKKDFGQHFGNFFMGGLGGIMQTYAMSNTWSSGKFRQAEGLFTKRFTSSLLGYGIEYIGTSMVKGNYQGLSTSGWETKAGVSLYKSLMYSLMLR